MDNDNKVNKIYEDDMELFENKLNAIIYYLKRACNIGIVLILILSALFIMAFVGFYFGLW